MSEDLGSLAVFVAVVEAQGFRAAGERLGVSGSAVSQTVRRLEARLGVTLLQRSTRSIRMTEAGERLYATMRPLLEEMRSAVVAVGELAEVPRGTVRLSVSGGATSFLRGAALEGFVRSHPDITLDIVINDNDSDIVAEGYDAGIRLGEVIDNDMIAVPVSGMERVAVVATPGYFRTHPPPQHPRDVVRHACINWRASADAAPYRWEFTENGQDFSVAVDARVITTDGSLMLDMALAGVGLTMVMAERAKPYVERGELVVVLEEYCPPFPGYYLYYPQRQHASAALRTLIEYLRGRATLRGESRPTRKRPRGR